MDVLSDVIEHLALRCRSPRVHTFEGSWAVEVSAGVPALHLVRSGHCVVWPAGARHSLGLSEGSLLFASGASPYVLQAKGPRLDVDGPFDWARGRSLGAARASATSPRTVQILSATLEIPRRPGPLHRLPEIVVVDVEQIPLPRSYRPIFDSLLEELAFPRIGTEAILRLLLQVLAIQALRIEVIGGGGTSGWLGALADPVLRTCLAGQEELSPVATARSLGATSLRSARRLSARVRAAAGTPPRALSQQLRLQRVLQLLEHGVHPLERVAQVTGFGSVSALCRSFRRELGMTPGAYWRQYHRRSLPRSAPPPHSP